MNWIERFLVAPIAPRAAFERARARYALRAFYEVTQPSRTRKPRTDLSSANAELNRYNSGVRLRTQARHLENNLDIAKGALDVLVANVVGKGIRPEPQVKFTDGTPAKAVNDALSALWADWVRVPEVTWEMDYYTAQRLACRTWLRDGEVLAQLISGSVATLDHGTQVPFSIELLEPDFLPFEVNDPAAGVYNGIGVNAWGRPRIYNLYKQHPGDSQTIGAILSNLKQVPAERMVHVKLMQRLHQLRGVTIFASVIGRFDDIKEIDESERVAARVAAAMAAYIKKGAPDQFIAPDTDENGNPKYRQLELEPGIVFDDLLPGEEVGTIASNRPNNALIPFRDAQLRSAASGLGSSYSSLSKNYNGTYSAQRQELVEQYMHYGVLSAYFVSRFCEPIWKQFVSAALAARQIRLPANLDALSLNAATHVVPQIPWIDPEKEAVANALLEDRLYKSRSQIIRERGGMPGDTLHEILRDKQEAERLGLTPTTKPLSPRPAAEDVPPPEAPPTNTAKADASRPFALEDCP